MAKGPTVIKSEAGMLVSYVYVDFSDTDVGTYVDGAKKAVSAIEIPNGYRLGWSGEYEYLVATHERLKMVIPLTAALIFILIYLNTGSVASTLIVL